MDNGAGRAILPIALLAGCLFVSRPASAQLVMGQYEDEAPLGTWNILGAPSAPSIGLGGIQFARAWDASASLANPALLQALPRLSASVSGSYAAAELFKYSLVNTGVVSSTGNLTAAVWAVDHVGVALRRGKWGLGLTVAVPESYDRPGIAVPYSNGVSSYELTMSQSGYLRVFHAGIARRLSARISLGLGANYAEGRSARTIIEQTADLERVVTITDDKRERYRGFFLNGGMIWELSSRLTGSLIFRSPYVKEAKAQSLLRYEVPTSGTDIHIEAEATNEYDQPWIVGAGGSYRLKGGWTLAAELAYFGWSRYEAVYFGEPLERSFRSIVKAGAGIEQMTHVWLHGRPVDIPLRLGFAFDPQPTKEPRSTYLSLTLGTGFKIRSLAVDLSGSLGRETGSGDSLKARKIVLSFRYVIDE